MFEQVLEENPERTILLDSSATTPFEHFSVIEQLYSGLEGLRKIHPDQVRKEIELFEELRGYFSARRIKTIEEVLEEQRRGLNLLNAHYQFIRDIDKLHGSRNGRKDRLTSEDLQDLERIDKLSNQLYKLIRTARRRLVTFSDGDEEYKKNFEKAMNYSIDLSRNSIRRKSLREKSPIFLGDSLQTDQKLVAAAYTLASRGTPTMILTRDQGMQALAERLKENIKDVDLETYNPDLVKLVA
jgi:hypothetical protein